LKSKLFLKEEGAAIMKKNNLTNQKLISAMLVGISAMMSISSPITAYAQDDENNIPDITPETAETSENENTESSSEESVTAEAQELATETQDAIEEASETLETIENVEEASIESLDTAAEKIDEVETDLLEADQADQEADEAAVEMVENVDEAVKVAESAQESAQEAKEQVEDLVEDITTAESVEDAQKSYDELVKVIEDTSFDINAKKEYFNELNGKYEDAKERLVQAEADYEAALNDASYNATTAREELEKAQAEVDTLGTIVEETKEKMEAQVEPAKEIKNSADKVVVDWGPQRNFMYTIIREYYIPQLVDSGATDIKEKYVKGYDTQDYNYNIITYKDSNGKKQTLYFNYDRADKYIKENNRYDNNALGKSTDIVIFEKTQEEIDANDYLKKYFAAHPTNENIRNMANAGKLDVFAYVEDGKTQFMVRKELEDALENGDITIDQDGKLYIGEAEIHEVVQNQNSKVHGGTNVVDTSDQAFIDFYTKAQERVDTYTNYEVAVENAGNAVDEAVEKAEQLEDAIDTLKDNRTNRIVKATEVLGVDDIAAYLNIEVTPEEANLLNNMTLNQAIRYLDRKLSEAKDKVAEAQADLDIILEQKEAGKAEYEAVVAKYSATLEEEKEPEVKLEEKAEETEVNEAEENLVDNKTEENGTEGEIIKDLENEEVPLAPVPAAAEENEETAENTAAAENQNEEVAEYTLPAGSTIQFIYVADTNDQNTDNTDDYQAPAYVAPEAFVVDSSMINIEDQITPLAAEMAVINEAEAADNTANEAAVEDADGEDTYTQIDDENVPSAAEMVANDVVKNTEQAFVSIEDEDTALADTFTEAKEEKTSLWWLILIAVLGTAGEEMYRRHKEKEAENSK